MYMNIAVQPKVKQDAVFLWEVIKIAFLYQSDRVVAEGYAKNVLQFWLCYVRKMVQFHVLDLVSSLTGHISGYP